MLNPASPALDEFVSTLRPRDDNVCKKSKFNMYGKKKSKFNMYWTGLSRALLFSRDDERSHVRRVHVDVLSDSVSSCMCLWERRAGVFLAAQRAGANYGGHLDSVGISITVQ